MVNAAHLLCVRGDSKVAQENMDLFRDIWQDKVRTKMVFLVSEFIVFSSLFSSAPLSKNIPVSLDLVSLGAASNYGYRLDYDS